MVPCDKQTDFNKALLLQETLKNIVSLECGQITNRIARRIDDRSSSQKTGSSVITSSRTPYII